MFSLLFAPFWNNCSPPGVEKSHSDVFTETLRYIWLLATLDILKDCDFKNTLLIHLSPLYFALNVDSQRLDKLQPNAFIWNLDFF